MAAAAMEAVFLLTTRSIVGGGCPTPGPVQATVTTGGSRLDSAVQTSSFQRELKWLKSVSSRLTPLRMSHKN